MPDREFIHSREDVSDAFRYARTLGLKVLPGAARAVDVSEPLSADELEYVDRGVFYLYRTEWIDGPLQVLHIDAGANAGKYVVKSNVNFSVITIYFQGEAIVGRARQLGAGAISFKRDWLHSAAHEMRPAPDGVAKDYAAMCKHLLSRDVVRAGVHRYYVARHAARLASSEVTRPPFDFIPWPLVDPPRVSGSTGNRRK